MRQSPMDKPATNTLPEALLQWFKPEADKHLRCSQVSENEFRVEIITHTDAPAPGPVAMLGYARQFHPDRVPTTDEVMRELRAGDCE